MSWEEKVRANERKNLISATDAISYYSPLSGNKIS